MEVKEYRLQIPEHLHEIFKSFLELGYQLVMERNPILDRDEQKVMNIVKEHCRIP